VYFGLPCSRGAWRSLVLATLHFVSFDFDKEMKRGKGSKDLPHEDM